MHIPPKPFPRQRADGGTQAHPKRSRWSGRQVLNPWPRPWQGRALPTELHPQILRGSPPASTGAASRHLVKEHLVADDAEPGRRHTALARRRKTNKKARNPLGSPGLCERWKQVRLRVSWPRTALPMLNPARPRLMASKLDPACAQHRGGARKADPARGAGQILVGCVGGDHDGFLLKGARSVRMDEL